MGFLLLRRFLFLRGDVLIFQDIPHRHLVQRAFRLNLFHAFNPFIGGFISQLHQMKHRLLIARFQIGNGSGDGETHVVIIHHVANTLGRFGKPDNPVELGDAHTHFKRQLCITVKLCR